MTQDTLNALEQLIDSHGLDFVLRSISDVCRDKADHIRGNWQDYNAADVWDDRANHVDACVSKILDT